MPSSEDAAAAATHQFDSIEDAITAFKKGDFIIVLDSPSRENEGDLIIAASAVTPQKMAFMIHHTSGLLCAPLPPHLTSALDLPQMLPLSSSQDPKRTAYTISIDAEHPSTTTGISASDRALTCNMLAAKNAKAADFRRPGHVFPLMARGGGIRERQGHTEAAVEFCRLSGMGEVGVISELVEEGEEVEGEAIRMEPGMMRRDGCLAFGKRWGMRVVTIEDLVEYVEKKEGGRGKGVNGVEK